MNVMNYLSYYAGASLLKLEDELRSARLKSLARQVQSRWERVSESRSGELIREIGDDPGFVPYRQHALAFEFDATPWFREADPRSILQLAEQGWSSVWIADALEARPSYEGLHQLIEYASTRLRDESLEDPTRAAIECIVSQPDATQ